MSLTPESIRVGGKYLVKYKNKNTVVTVFNIRTGAKYRGKNDSAKTVWDVVVDETGVKTSFSTFKFLSEVPSPAEGEHSSDPTPTSRRKKGSLSSSTAGEKEKATTVPSSVESAGVKSAVRPVSKFASSLKEKMVAGKQVAEVPVPVQPTVAIKDEVVRPGNKFPHLMIVARAGCGKTTTLVESLKCLRGMTPTIKPSPQQAEIWSRVARMKDMARKVAFVSFNSSIAQELGRRVPPGVEAMTLHSLGFRAVRNSFTLLPGDQTINKDRLAVIIGELLGMHHKSVMETRPELYFNTRRLVDLCKQTLADPYDREFLIEMASFYDIEMDAEKEATLDLVPAVYERCKNVLKDKFIDFNDMIWLPVVLGLPLTPYDVLFVDEAQDLNRCQQELARRSAKTLVLCGDPKQAIYGFAGADHISMTRLEEELKATPESCEVLPLTVTFRCGKAIVDEARKLVEDFSAHETNPPGLVRNTPSRTYSAEVNDGDFILCRINAPLVSQCFKFLKEGRKATIQGRDIGKGLIKLIQRMKARNVMDLVEKIQKWREAEQANENKKDFPSESKLIAIDDKADCLVTFTELADSVDDVIAKINSIFTDNPSPGIRLSSIHKAKGLEARRVFIYLDDAPLPHPMARTKSAVEQEWNLKYVAVTRAIEELVFVTKG